MRMATCHPDVKHHAKGMCKSCYNRKAASSATKVRKREIRAAQDDWKSRNKDRIKNNAYKNKYGITLEQVEALKKKQKNRCAICNKVRKLNVDHHHDSNTVRGLLCGTCNRGIGSMQECTDTLMSAVKYLMYWANKYKGKPNV